MKTGISFILVAIFATSSAYAARQTIQCSDSHGDYKVVMAFDPEVQLEKIWNDYHVEPYRLGNEDAHGFTAARMKLFVGTSEFKRPYAGTFLLSEFYEVNKFEKAGFGYSVKFGGQAYRIFHGQDKAHRWDTIVYIPDAVLGKEVSSFPALTTIQPDMANQGYYHIDMMCSSRLQ